MLEFVQPDFNPQAEIFSEEDDLNDIFGTRRGGEKYIGKYTIRDIENFIRNSPISQKLEKSGYTDWYVEFDLSDCFSHFGYLRSRSLPEKEKFLSFIIIQNGEFQVKNPKFLSLPNSLNMLDIRWFALQDPLKNFSPNKPRLPGQRYPGTGFGRDCFNLLIQLASLSQRDGISNTPEHFHNAFLYEGFQFLDPADQGKFDQIVEDLNSDIQGRGLSAVSWAIYLGFLRENGNLRRWEMKEQLLPLSNRMKNFFRSSEYLNVVKNTKKASGTFSIEWEEAEKVCLTQLLQFSENEIVRNLK